MNTKEKRENARRLRANVYSASVRIYCQNCKKTTNWSVSASGNIEVFSCLECRNSFSKVVM